MTQKLSSVQRCQDKALAHHLPTDICQNDLDLATVVAAWPDLPEALKAGIVAMVNEASGRGGEARS
jgi:hypothetical protein